MTVYAFPQPWASITQSAFSIPDARWRELGSPTYVQLWYRGMDTVVTLAPGIVTSECPYHRRSFRMQTIKNGARVRPRVACFWKQRSGSHLVVWKPGRFEIESTVINGEPALVVRGTNQFSIDMAELNDWRDTNRRVLETPWSTGLLGARPRPQFQPGNTLRVDGSGFKPGHKFSTKAYKSSLLHTSGSPSIGFI